jgi:hypothetical protein
MGQRPIRNLEFKKKGNEPKQLEARALRRRQASDVIEQLLARIG